MNQSVGVTPRIRRAQGEEREAVGRLLSDAFMEDPVSRWVFPDRAHRHDVQPRFFGVFLDAALESGRVDVTDDLTAAALWLPVPAGSGEEQDGDDEMAARFEAADPGNERTAVVGRLTSEAHPQGRAHHYLPLIGVTPARHGEGLGRALLTEALDRCDDEGSPAYLEASNARSKALYERLGFSVTDRIVRLPDGPPMWPMWYEPGARGIRL
ncbi:GNAT family N-acetyltransferase [Streptomyces sp. NPDC051776]|uniref:GNAT family N-acetyltransferase n=1 Tax=Streptomyces sp. NPDC051776 TaxID=3155414 RepID=UPI00341AECA2